MEDFTILEGPLIIMIKAHGSRKFLMCPNEYVWPVWPLRKLLDGSFWVVIPPI